MNGGREGQGVGDSLYAIQNRHVDFTYEKLMDHNQYNVYTQETDT